MLSYMRATVDVSMKFGGGCLVSKPDPAIHAGVGWVWFVTLCDYMPLKQPAEANFAAAHALQNLNFWQPETP